MNTIFYPFSMHPLAFTASTFLFSAKKKTQPAWEEEENNEESDFEEFDISHSGRGKKSEDMYEQDEEDNYHIEEDLEFLNEDFDDLGEEEEDYHDDY